MAVTIKHTFTNPVADDPAFSGVKPSHWNADHTVLGLGTAAEQPASAFATAAQGAKADTAVQPGSLATVATTGAYSDLSGKPTLGTAAALNAGSSANNLVQLDGSGKLPAVDGSQLTGLGSSGIPSGGSTGQALTKASASDYDVEWTTPSGSGDMLESVYDPQGIGEDAFDVDNHTDGTTNKVYPATDKSKLSGITAGADPTGATIHAASGKTTPVDADTTALIDSAASNALKKLTWANLKATLKTYFDTLYQAAGSYLTASSTATLTNKTFDAAGTGNSLSNIATSMFAANVIDTDNTLAADSDTRLASQKAVKKYVDDNSGGGSGLPTGSVIPFAGSSAPTGFLLCYGQDVSRSTYSDLYTAIGDIYGNGDGSTTFNVPDLRGRVAAGKDDMGGSAASRLTNSGTGNPGVNGASLGAVGGVDRHQLTIAQLASHTHTEAGATTGAGGGNRMKYETLNGLNTTTNSSTLSTGGDEAHPNVQPTIVLNYIIKT